MATVQVKRAVRGVPREAGCGDVRERQLRRTKEVLFLELHHSLAKFVSCKVFVHKHPRQCIPLRRWTKPHYFVSWRTKTQVICNTSGVSLA